MHEEKKGGRWNGERGRKGKKRERNRGRQEEEGGGNYDNSLKLSATQGQRGSWQAKKNSLNFFFPVSSTPK